MMVKLLSTHFHSFKRPTIGPTKHKVESAQRYKARYCISKHGEYSPNTLPLDTFRVIQQRQPQTSEIVDKRRTERPQKVPSEDFAHRRDILAHRKNDFKAV